MAKAKKTWHPVGIEDISVSQLKVDHSYQRLPTVNLHRMVQRFDDRLLGNLHVSRRRDGSLWVVDGQHRKLACQEIKRSTVRCLVYEGMDLEDEAALFRGLNNTKSILPYFTFRADYLAGSSEQVEIEKTFAARGQSIVAQLFRAPRCAEWIYRGCGGRTERGPAVLSWALDVYLGAWPAPEQEQRSWVDGQVLKAIAAVYAAHPKAQAKNLVKKLAGTAPIALIASATSMMSGPLWSRLAFIIVNKYNAKLQHGRLPQWEIHSRDGVNGHDVGAEAEA